MFQRLGGWAYRGFGGSAVPRFGGSALSKHCPSLVQADHFCVQARLGHTSDPLGFCHFEVTKSLPKFPFYNIKRDQAIKNGGQNNAWPPAGQAF